MYQLRARVVPKQANLRSKRSSDDISFVLEGTRIAERSKSLRWRARVGPRFNQRSTSLPQD